MATGPVTPRNNHERVLYETLEVRGEANVRADLSAQRWGGRTRDVQEWLNRKDELRAEDDAALAVRNTEAAEAAADATNRSAAAAESAARHARIAWVVALVSTFISIVALFKK